jgi:hypothetical protein
MTPCRVIFPSIFAIFTGQHQGVRDQITDSTGEKYMRTKLSEIFAIALLCSTSVFGQVAITGKITGYVLDTSGAGVAGATVNVTSGALMAPRAAKTQNNGSFLFDELQVGTYEVKVVQQGFKTAIEPNVVLTAGFTATLNIKLEVGDLGQSVTITAEEPVIDVKSVERRLASPCCKIFRAGEIRGRQWR